MKCHWHVLHVASDESLGGLNGIGLALHHEQGGQRLKSLFAGNLCTSAPLGLVGQINILKFGIIPAVVDTLFQFVGQLSLLADGLQDGLFPLGRFLQPCVHLADLCYLHLVESASAFLAVA